MQGQGKRGGLKEREFVVFRDSQTSVISMLIPMLGLYANRGRLMALRNMLF